MKQKKLVCGIGINDADYVVSIKETICCIMGKQKQKVVWSCPYYEKWKNMIRRGHSSVFKAKVPVYEDISVCEDWHIFSNFRKWMIEQPWERMQLDKDILVKGNKVYSPETCLFVPQRVNKCLLCNSENRGKFPIGVTYYIKSNNFMSQVSEGKGDQTKYLGLFPTPLEAHAAWQKAKADVIKETVSWWASDPEVKHSFNTRAADALIQRAWQLRLDCAMGIETVSL